MRPNLIHMGGLVLLAATAAQAGTPVFDFETDAELSCWSLRSKTQDRLERSPRFATSGQSSLRFWTPAWKEGLEQWPAFEVKPQVTDWTGYDRLVVDIVNPSSDRHFLALFVSDSKIPFRDGLSFHFTLPATGYQRYTVPLSSFPPAVNRADIAILHFFSQRPSSEMTIYLDQVVLLKPGEVLPEPGSGFVRQLAELLQTDSPALDAALATGREAAAKIGGPAAVAQRAAATMDRLTAELAAARAELAGPNLTLAQLTARREAMALLPVRVSRAQAEWRLAADYAAVGQAANGMAVGFVTSMEKVLPRDVPFAATVAKEVKLSLARNEKESFQVLVLATDGPLHQVQLSTTELRSDTGAVLAQEQVHCEVVGYVQTKARPPYTVSYVGWWPDPILDFLGPVEIATGDLQAFWIRVRASKTQAPGTYRGTLSVAAAGVASATFGLTVQVRAFALPDCTPLPTAITFFEQKAQMGGEENWPKMKLAYADFLADYAIDYDSLYRQGPPDYEILKHLHEQGRLVAFNLGNVFNAGVPTEGFDKAIAETVARLRVAYDQAKALGLLDHAYIYGFDEQSKGQFGVLERSAQALRQAFPEVLLMTTSYDDSFGLDSEVKTIDAWCPLTPKFDTAQAAMARAAGKKVWWYICCGPHNPYANWFVEYAAIESRLLMGAMTAKFRPDGFLYYSLTIWNRNRPIEKGPFTDWDPVSWTTYHGDGSLFCSGPGGKPVPTIRLENYRDGMEDYAYVCILEEITRRFEADQAKLTPEQTRWLTAAKAALVVPAALVKTMSEYSHDPQVLYAYREQVADLIDQSGVTDADPWGKDFAVRGLRQPVR
jgi:hypothetical protein